MAAPSAGFWQRRGVLGLYALLLTWWRHRVPFVISGFITFFALALYYFTFVGERTTPIFNFIQRLEYDSLDTRFRYRPRSATPLDPRIVIVDIDQHAQEVLGKWPFSRTHFAKMLDVLREDGAKVVAFDVTFSKPDLSAAQYDADKQFASAIQRFGAVVLGNFFLHTEADLRGLDDKTLDTYANQIAFYSFPSVRPLRPETGKRDRISLMEKFPPAERTSCLGIWTSRRIPHSFRHGRAGSHRRPRPRGHQFSRTRLHHLPSLFARRCRGKENSSGQVWRQDRARRRHRDRHWRPANDAVWRAGFPRRANPRQRDRLHSAPVVSLSRRQTNPGGRPAHFLLRHSPGNLDGPGFAALDVVRRIPDRALGCRRLFCISTRLVAQLRCPGARAEFQRASRLLVSSAVRGKRKTPRAFRFRPVSQSRSHPPPARQSASCRTKENRHYRHVQRYSRLHHHFRKTRRSGSREFPEPISFGYDRPRFRAPRHSRQVHWRRRHGLLGRALRRTRPCRESLQYSSENDVPCPTDAKEMGS